MEQGSIFHQICPESHVGPACFLVFLAGPPSGDGSLSVLVRLATAHRTRLEIR